MSPAVAATQAPRHMELSGTTNSENHIQENIEENLQTVV